MATINAIRHKTSNMIVIDTNTITVSSSSSSFLQSSLLLSCGAKINKTNFYSNIQPKLGVYQNTNYIPELTGWLPKYLIST